MPKRFTCHINIKQRKKIQEQGKRDNSAQPWNLPTTLTKTLIIRTYSMKDKSAPTSNQCHLMRGSFHTWYGKGTYPGTQCSGVGLVGTLFWVVYTLFIISDIRICI